MDHASHLAARGARLPPGAVPRVSSVGRRYGTWVTGIRRWMLGQIANYDTRRYRVRNVRASGISTLGRNNASASNRVTSNWLGTRPGSRTCTQSMRENKREGEREWRTWSRRGTRIRRKVGNKNFFRGEGFRRGRRLEEFRGNRGKRGLRRRLLRINSRWNSSASRLEESAIRRGGCLNGFSYYH